MPTPQTFRRIAVVTALVLGLAAGRAEAAIVIQSDNGWSASFDGFLNLFLVDTFGQAPPAGQTDIWSAPTADNTFRVRTGFLPSAFGFNASAPEWEGLTAKLRVGVYVQLNSDNTRTTPTAGPNYANAPLIDWREFNVTVGGKFGEILVGRALNLYQADAVLSDISLYGVGIPGQIGGGRVLGGWPTLGHIGFGYLYPAFGAQFRYTTPDMSGLKLAVAVGDPSRICGATGCATTTAIPDLEATLTYSTKMDNVKVKAWLGGIFGRAWFVPGTTGSEGANGLTGAVNGYGGAAGVDVGVSGFDVVGSGFWAKGMGTYQQYDGADSFDAQGNPIISGGFLVQATYQADKTKIGINFGETFPQNGNTFNLKTRTSVTVGVYHDLTSWLKLVAEYSWYGLTWNGVAGGSNPSQNGNVLALGGFFFW